MLRSSLMCELGTEAYLNLATSNINTMPPFSELYPPTGEKCPDPVCPNEALEYETAISFSQEKVLALTSSSNSSSDLLITSKCQQFWLSSTFQQRKTNVSLANLVVASNPLHLAKHANSASVIPFFLTCSNGWQQSSISAI